MELSLPVLLFLVFVVTILVWCLIGKALMVDSPDAVFVGIVHAVIIMIGVWTHSYGYAYQTLLMAVFAGAWFGYAYAKLKYY